MAAIVADVRESPALNLYANDILQNSKVGSQVGAKNTQVDANVEKIPYR